MVIFAVFVTCGSLWPVGALKRPRRNRTPHSRRCRTIPSRTLAPTHAPRFRASAWRLRLVTITAVWHMTESPPNGARVSNSVGLEVYDLVTKTKSRGIDLTEV